MAVQGGDWNTAWPRGGASVALAARVRVSSPPHAGYHVHKIRRVNLTYTYRGGAPRKATLVRPRSLRNSRQRSHWYLPGEPSSTESSAPESSRTYGFTRAATPRPGPQLSRRLLMSGKHLVGNAPVCICLMTNMATTMFKACLRVSCCR